MKQPCPYCKRMQTTTYEAMRGVDEGSIIRVRRIEHHDCPSFRTEEPLASTDPDFMVIPSRDAADLNESLRRYRRSKAFR